MKSLAEEILRRCAADQRVALCIVVQNRGSTPQERGAKMLVLQDGQTLGTLGGGCVEAEVRRQALELLEAGTSKALRFTLDHDYGWDDGLICGGVMDIYVQLIDPPTAEPYRQIAAALKDDRSATLDFLYKIEGRELRYIEDLGPPPLLLIVGAGHVGQALAQLASTLDFQIDLIDDRPDAGSAERFPTVRRRIIGDIESELKKYPISPETYVVIVTRGHRHDGLALAMVAGAGAKYVGLIGSKSKVKTILDDLAKQGVDRSCLMRVHAPIGLEIGAVTVPEIALSIAAELIAVRRGRENIPAGPMKMDEDQLRQWLDRKV